MTALDKALAALVRGESGVWKSAHEWSHDEFFAAADGHGITSLIAHQVRATPAGDQCPPAMHARLKLAAVRRTGLESLCRRELRNVLDALAAAGVQPIVFKGTALAYSVYPHAALRERNDTDLLVAPEDFPSAERALAGVGYRRQLPLGAGETTQQALFRKPDGLGGMHDLDVHWGICNRPLLKGYLTFAELAAQAEALPALHPAAAGPSRLHALLIAAVHRVAHHKNALVLGWLYDIDLLTRALEPAGLDAFRRLAEEKGVSAMCAEALVLANRELGCLAAHREWVGRWSVEAGALKEPAAIYLTRVPWIGDGALSDFATLPGWSARVRFLREIVWPAPAYMFDRYGTTPRVLLPLLHVRRLTVGVWNLARRAAKDLRRSMTESVGPAL